MRFPALRLLLLTALLLTPTTGAAATQEVYVRARVDDHGDLQITNAAGRQITVPAEGDKGLKVRQVAFGSLAISPGGNVVGWIAYFPNCCTSYAVPTKLVIYKNGRIRTLADQMPVWRWAFFNGGTQVGFQQMPLHGTADEYYELREVSTGRRLAHYVAVFNKPTEPPPWVKVVASQK